MCLALFTLGLLVPLTTLAYNFLKESNESPKKPADYEFPAVSDLKLTLLSTAIFAVVEFTCRRVFFKLFEPFCKEQKDLVLREKRSQKASFCIYKACYFIWATSFGYIVLKDTTYLPPALGGSGNVDLTF